MKTNDSRFLKVTEAVCPTNRHALGSVVVTDLLSMVAAVALVLPCGCSTAGTTGTTVSSAPPLAEETRLQLGTVALIPDSRPARFSFDKAKGRIGDAGEWAAAAAGHVLGTSTSEPALDLLAAPGTLVFTPVEAILAAGEAKKLLSPDKLAECETNLVQAMREMAVQERFHEWLLQAANEQCQGRLVVWDQFQDTGSGWVAPESVLEARVEELRLERTGSGDTSYRLRIRIRTRLLRAADGAVWCDRPAEYRSGKCLFSDWTLPNAFQSVAETGYRLLAEQCVSRLLTTTDRPVLAGAGYRKAPNSNRNVPASFAGTQPPASRPALTSVSYVVADTGTLGIYSTGNVAHVVLQRPLVRDEATSKALNDVRDAFGPFIEHPNMFVALSAIALATPVSICEQGAAEVRGLSPGTLGEADASLTKAANETRPHQELAVQVAQQLAPQTSQQVVLVRQPLPLGAEEDAGLMQCAARGTFAVLTGGQTAGGYLLSQGASTGVEIHVEDARLAGKEGINPNLALCVEARATVLRSSDGQQLYSCPVHYRSKSRHFTTWAAHDARLFREELQKCYHELSAIMVNQVVNARVVAPGMPPQPTFAQH